MKKIVVWIVGIGVLIGLVYMFYLSRRHRSASESTEKTIRVQRADVRVRAAETGSLEPANVVEIKSQQSGEIQTLYVHLGDRVAIAQPLALLQTESGQARRIAELRAAIAQERLNVETAKRERDRLATLFEKGFVARVELENAEQRLESAHLKRDLALHQLLLSLEGDRKRYHAYLKRPLHEGDIGDFTLYAPIAGTVIEMKVAEGEIVSSGLSTVSGGTTLMRLADLSKMLVKAKINEVNVGQLQEGQPVEITLDAIPHRPYSGRLIKISPRGEKENNIVVYEVTFEIENSPSSEVALLKSPAPLPVLMPGMTANVDILVAEAKSVLYLPRDAVVQQNRKATVTLPGGVTREIRLGLHNETVVEVREGLKEGDQVLMPKQKEEDSHS